MDKRATHIQQWIDAYSDSLLNSAFFLLSDKQDAEDVVQNVFISAFESYYSFEDRSSVKTWLMAILKNKVAEFYRKKYRHPDNVSLDRYFDQEGSWKHDDILQDWNEKDENLLDNNDFNKVMADCLDKLPLKWLIPVKLYYLEEKKADKVCQETGITATNLWKILQRGRMQLRECLEFNWFNIL
ncbi:sigma-70 family RNA polymerase sigma factor [Sphingobacterium sp. HMA12]|jgi:RNA polymerase sigma-70 factor (TIGR02943 family)|uniref:sigma-70 family RNA polymerase sigma factor n=1 Tax=Sphingobacterium sp. HMA12 TaxID=2050894 RepID=UPI000CE9F5E0|nr:sigma-70 family RNA polymerase sigma factor [Sphingobacterium sp. HMA12]